jgi:hypothetical protein
VAGNKAKTAFCVISTEIASSLATNKSDYMQYVEEIHAESFASASTRSKFFKFLMNPLGAKVGPA